MKEQLRLRCIDIRCRFKHESYKERNIEVQRMFHSIGTFATVILYLKCEVHMVYMTVQGHKPSKHEWEESLPQRETRSVRKGG